MKTAQGSISIDVSKFNSGIENAKAKLASFGSSLSTVGSVARTTWKVFDLVTGVSERISIIAKGGKDLQSIFNALPTVIKRVSDGFSNLKTFASQVGDVLSKIPTTFKVIGASAVVAGVSIFGAVKALQAISGATKSALSGISSVASGLSNMAKSASTAVSGAVLSGFRGLLNVLKPIGLAVGGLGVAFGALDRFFKIGITSAIEMGDEMKNLSARTGASIPFLVDFQKILKNAGVSGMTGAVAIQNLQRALTGINADGEPTNDMIKRLGLNLDEMANMTEEQKVLQTGIAIMKLGNASERTTASFAMFGRAGASMNAVFQDPAFLELGTKQSQLGISLAKNADNFSKISAKLRDSGSFFRGFFVEMAGAVAPSILEIFKLFEGNDMLTGFGAKLGEQIRFGLEVLIGAFRSGMIFDLLKTSFEASGVVLKDLLERTFTYGSALIANLMQSDISTALLSAIKGAGLALLGVFSIASGGLVKLLATPLAFFSAGFQTALEKGIQYFAEKFPKTAKAIGIGGFTAGSFGENMAERKTAIEGFANQTISSGFENVTSGMSDAISGAVESFKILKDTVTKFPEAGENVKNILADLTGRLDAVAVAGRAVSSGQGQIAGSEVLGAKVAKSTSGRGVSEGISSLRRIGGGGSAFSGRDPLVEIAKQQLAEAKAQTQIQKKELEKPRLPNTVGGVAILG
jgi:hypothetical protein